MTELQEHLLVLLKEIDGLCRANNIDYYLMSGTAIGAVRHKGFIPWDDDADICMTLENWEKFYSIRSQMRPDRALVCLEGDYSARNVINKYVDVTTTRLMTYDVVADIPAGIPIDIFVLDTIPDTLQAREEYCKNVLRFVNLFYRSTVHTHRVPFFLDDVGNFDECEKRGMDVVLAERKAAIEQYRGMEAGVYALRDPLGFRFFPKESIGRPCYVDFEDTQLPVAADPTIMLTEIYSDDWICLPRSAEFRPHEAGIIFGMSGNNALDDFNKTVDQDDLESVFGAYNREANMVGELNKQQNWERLKFVAAKVKMRYPRDSFDSSKLLAHLQAGDFDTLDAFFEEYQFYQCHSLMIGDMSFAGQIGRMRPFYIDLGDGFLCVFLRYLMHSETPARAARILKGRHMAQEPSAKTLQIQVLIDNIRHVCSLIWAGSYAQARKIAAGLYGRFPENLSASRLYWAAAFLEARGMGLLAAWKRARLRKRLSDLPDSYVNDVTLSLQLEYNLLEENNDKLVKDIQAVMDITQDVFVLNRLREILQDELKPSNQVQVLLDNILARLGQV